MIMFKGEKLSGLDFKFEDVILSNEQIQSQTLNTVGSFAYDFLCIPADDYEILESRVDFISYVDPQWTKNYFDEIPHKGKLLLICISSWISNARTEFPNFDNALFAEEYTVLYEEHILVLPDHGISLSGVWNHAALEVDSHFPKTFRENFTKLNPPVKIVSEALCGIIQEKYDEDPNQFADNFGFDNEDGSYDSTVSVSKVDGIDPNKIVNEKIRCLMEDYKLKNFDDWQDEL